MTNLKTEYMGIELANPFIVGSCGLTRNLEGVRRCADAGAGAVVLKSIFEEVIVHETRAEVDAAESSMWHPEALEYTRQYARENEIGSYLRLVSDAKKAVEVPVIASVHCVSSSVWPQFAERIEDAGADGLELNVFVLPSDPSRAHGDLERLYDEVAEAVTSRVKIPVALKLGSYFTALAATAARLGGTGVKGLTLFNRFFSSDIDPGAMSITRAPTMSGPEEYVLPLRWISILSGRVGCDLCASTGIHDAATAAKMLLAGARAVQVVSALYKNGVDHLGEMAQGLAGWMEEKGFEDLGAFRGKLSQSQADNPAAWERVQFMKFSAGVE